MDEQRRRPGKVYLIGAGPGRPDLLTLRGAECLSQADVVVRDASVSERVLEHCRPETPVLLTRRGIRRRPMGQAEINRRLVRLARSGKIVARLKVGDPFFFSRGAEEAEFLARRHVPFEVVPGVSSVTAVPAYAGVPITHREYASVLTVVSGPAGRENTYWAGPGQKNVASVRWEALPPQGTLVILMGVGELRGIAQRLMLNGWLASTPVLVARWGTLPAQKIVEGVLGDIAPKAEREGMSAPAVIVVGKVAAFRRRLGWFERLPLFGRTVLVTRAASRSDALTALLENEGARVLVSPAVRFEPVKPAPRWRRCLRNISRYDGVLFTSATTVRIFSEHWREMSRDWPVGVAVYAVGGKTAEQLVRNGFPVHGIGKDAAAGDLVDVLGETEGRRYLFPRAAEGRDELVEKLRAAGASLDLWPLYRTRPVKMEAGMRSSLLAGTVDGVLFASPSAVGSVLGSFSPRQRRKIFSRTRLFSIGPTTTRALKDFGMRRVHQATRSTMESLAVTVQEKLKIRRRNEGGAYENPFR
ncbi:MAG TPA: uroporphyrinogen-III C-methyltransferase [Elusimicrobiota bacterium]|nr:uroporphyrinogen-III C-methyltransferase [Elusimicrobiota bacterium]